MAWSGWSISATPTFRALSYDEWSKPLEQATKLHQDIEEQYGALDEQASEYEKLANDWLGKDSKAYNQYKKYADDLRKSANDLATNGLGYNSRKNMLNMKARYSKEIHPIQEAMERRKEVAKMQQEMLAKNPNLLFDKKADLETVDFFMDNPNWNFKSLDMNEVYKKAWDQFGTFKNQIILANDSIPKDAVGRGEKIAENLKWMKSSVPGFYERYIKEGYNPEAIADALNDPTSDLSRTLMNEIAATGMEDWNNAYSYDVNTRARYKSDDDRIAADKREYENKVNRLLNFIKPATLNAMGETKFDKMEDTAWRLATEHNYRIKEADHTNQLAMNRDAANRAAAAGAAEEQERKQYVLTDAGEIVALADGEDTQTAIKIRTAREIGNIKFGDKIVDGKAGKLTESQIEDINNRVLTELGKKYQDAGTIDYKDPQVQNIIRDELGANPSRHHYHPFASSKSFLSTSAVDDYMKKYNYESYDNIIDKRIKSGKISEENAKKIREYRDYIARCKQAINNSSANAHWSWSYDSKKINRNIADLEKEINKANEKIATLSGVKGYGKHNYDFSNIDEDIHDSKRIDIGMRSTNNNDALTYPKYIASLNSDPTGTTTVLITDKDGNTRKETLTNVDLASRLNAKGDDGKQGVMTYSTGLDPKSRINTLYKNVMIGGQTYRMPVDRRDINMKKREFDDHLERSNGLSDIVFGNGKDTYQMGRYTDKQKKFLVEKGYWDGNGKPPSRDALKILQKKEITILSNVVIDDEFYNWKQDSGQGYNGYKSGDNSAGNVDYFDGTGNYNN